MGIKQLAKPAKAGTQPWQIVIDGRFTLQVGKIIRFRRAGHGEKWMRGEVTRINDIPFITLI